MKVTPNTYVTLGRAWWKTWNNRASAWPKNKRNFKWTEVFWKTTRTSSAKFIQMLGQWQEEGEPWTQLKLIFWAPNGWALKMLKNSHWIQQKHAKKKLKKHLSTKRVKPWTSGSLEMQPSMAVWLVCCSILIELRSCNSNGKKNGLKSPQFAAHSALKLWDHNISYKLRHGIADKCGYSKCGEYQFYMHYHALKDDKQITSDNYFDVTRCNCPKQCSGWSFDSIDHDPKVVEEANNSNNSSNASAIRGFVLVVFF